MLNFEFIISKHYNSEYNEKSIILIQHLKLKIYNFFASSW